MVCLSHDALATKTVSKRCFDNFSENFRKLKEISILDFDFIEIVVQIVLQ